MSNISKIVLGIAVVGIVGGVVWYMSNNSSSSSYQNQMGMQAQTNTGTAGNDASPSDANASASSDNSDAAMAQDANNIDTQMNGLNSDNASTDQSLNSQ